jgi:hypothetical protein
MKKIRIGLAMLAAVVLAGCATRSLHHKTTKTLADGTVVVTEITAKVNSFCYDSSLEGFAWDSSASNTSVRVNKHGSTGGATNVAVVTEAAGKWADAIKALAEAAK